MLRDPAAPVGMRSAGTRLDARRLRPRVVVLVSVAMAGALAGLASPWCQAEPSVATRALPSAIGWSWLGWWLAALALGLAGWALWRRHVALAGLHAARVHAQSLGDVLDVWQWQTDARHVLVSARPPSGAVAADWRLGTERQPLSELFSAGRVGELEARMSSAAPLDDVSVVRLTDAGASVQGNLRGRALIDETGRFAGYIGTVREQALAGAASHGSPSDANDPLLISAEPAPIEDPLDNDRESFSYTVSHDLRAPIRVVEGFTKIVKEDYGRVLDRVGHDHLDRVLGAAARMNNMIDALLALSKLSSHPVARQPVNLTKMAGFVAEDLRRQWPDSPVQLDVAPGLIAMGDPTLLRLVLENLLGNAWKYTSNTAVPHVWFEPLAGQPQAFTVRDNGAGFDMRFADRLFTVFQRLHSASEFPGHGVGLASVRRIVRRHGGEIWAEAAPDEGAKFHFSLPGAEAQQP